MEIEWAYTMNRASRQAARRIDDGKALPRDSAQKYIAYLESLDPLTDDGLNDLHMRYGAMCALAALQIALPGRIETEVPSEAGFGPPAFYPAASR